MHVLRSINWKISALLTCVLLGPFASAGKAHASIQCYQCHGTALPPDYRPVDALHRNITSGGFQGNHQTHLGAPSSYAACAKCHPGSDVYLSSHRDGLIKVSGRINDSPLVTPYNNTTSVFSQKALATPGSCDGVNCHFEKVTPAWGDMSLVAPGDCNTCHDAPPNDRSHPYGARKHAAYYGATTASCVKCHLDHTLDANPFAHATSAGKRGLTVSFAAAPNNGFGRYTGSSTDYPDYLPSQAPLRNGACKGTYCHSPGTKSTNVTAPNQSATWGGTLGCDGCHAATPNTGSHLGHVATTYGVPVTCTKCHNATVNSGSAISSTANHVNRLVNVAFNSSTTAVFGRYSGHLAPMQKNPGSGYGNCENVYCHSSGQGAGGSWPPAYSAPKWGNSATGKCPSCHDNGYHGGGNKISSGSHDKHMNYGFTRSDVNGCGICHYGAGFADRQEDCSQCHFGPPNLTTLHANHKVDVYFVSKYGGSYNGTPEPGDGYGACANVYCHSSGVSVSTGSIPPNTSPAWGTGAMACSGCHGNPPAYGNNSPKKNSHPAHASYTCNKCHYRTTTDGTSITNSANHVNKAYDVYSGAGARFTYTYNAAGGTCASISCHGAGSSSAQWGSTSCLGCHSIAQGNRAAITGQFGANSHHIQGTVTDAKCYQCHWEANSDGTINSSYHNATVSGAAVRLVIYSTQQRPTNSAKYFIAYTANGKRAQIQKITTHCLGCHSDQNNSATPFSDGKTPRWYAWDETDKASHTHDGTSVAARYSQTGTTTWGKYTSASYPNTAKKKISKAYSAHGNSSLNKRYWDTTSGVDGDMSSQNTSGTVSVQCYDCHNSHGSTAAGITSRYSSATGRNRGGILKNTVRGFGGYSTTYRPQAAGSVANKDFRNSGANLCLDCHFSSTPKQAPLATFKGYTTPWGYNSTFGATQGILGYWDSPFMGSASAGADKRYPYKSLKQVKGGHFGAYTSLKVQPSSANQISGLCTPCHDPHGVSPTLGIKQQYSVPLLKGTWLTSPYKEDVAPASNVAGTIRTDEGFDGVPYHIDQNTFGSNIGSNIGSGAVTGLAFNNISTSAGLCLGCHPKNSLTDGVTHTWKDKNRVHESVKGWKSSGGSVKHTYSCSKCHSAHTNSVLPRLMVTNCLDGMHKGQSAYNPAAAITGTGSGDEIGCYGMATKSPTCAGPNYLFASGSGHIPGYYHGGDNSYNPMTCHEVRTGSASGTDQNWNNVTPW